ncbi:S-adenosylmethionine decarboxylase proenzyme [Kordiimonas laminariae]|uniref:S-adenosylmethionine decarboxylase proenzyme n=1 Tax=Kordiimonas laminariae TaxID=2917717 RepID=UPI001FF49110|nr:S-adenosylmethionine decarboxylase proenzyme [Kordiimonas laminariae]MCK0070641.1 S-adenosylmethionine decarboxylase proenzyme [Kordiimonas laminariae]
MFFEGSEKKAEIILSSNKINLLDDTYNDFWADMVEKCHAQILSSTTNDRCKAFLLSESSLFVWSDRLLILTCGTTRLVKAVEYFLQKFGTDAVEQVIYQRKNEYFSHKQHSNVLDDVALLNEYVPGSTFRFGELDSHHGYLFSVDNDFRSQDSDRTYELLVYQIGREASTKLTDPSLSCADVFEFLELDEIIPGFQVDDFLFEPFGYSLNAIKGDDYLTIHITPQANSSYVSFESSVDLIEHAPRILKVLRPASFDLMTYNDFDFADRISEMIPEEYVSKELVSYKMPSGYDVKFASFLRPQTKFTEPTKVFAQGEDYVL